MSSEEHRWWGIISASHDDVIKWKHFPRNWPFVRGIHRSPVKSPHKGQWRGALMFSLICARINGWVNNGEAGDLRRYRAHYDVSVMQAVWKGNLMSQSFINEFRASCIYVTLCVRFGKCHIHCRLLTVLFTNSLSSQNTYKHIHISSSAPTGF